MENIQILINCKLKTHFQSSNHFQIKLLNLSFLEFSLNSNLCRSSIIKAIECQLIFRNCSPTRIHLVVILVVRLQVVCHYLLRRTDFDFGQLARHHMVFWGCIMLAASVGLKFAGHVFIMLELLALAVDQLLGLLKLALQLFVILRIVYARLCPTLWSFAVSSSLERICQVFLVFGQSKYLVL